MPARAVAHHTSAPSIRENCAELQKMGSGWRVECSAFPLSPWCVIFIDAVARLHADHHEMQGAPVVGGLGGAARWNKRGRGREVCFEVAAGGHHW